jgi:hypothetical protein
MTSVEPVLGLSEFVHPAALRPTWWIRSEIEPQRRRGTEDFGRWTQAQHPSSEATAHEAGTCTRFSAPRLDELTHAVIGDQGTSMPGYLETLYEEALRVESAFSRSTARKCSRI